MKILKLIIIPIFALSLPFSCFAQDIVGSWKWSNDKYEGVAVFDSNAYFSAIYFKGTQAKVLEVFNYYHFDKNKLYFLEKPYTGDADKKTATVYKVKVGGSNGFQLAGNSGMETYNKLTSTGSVVKYRANEFYVNSGLTCIDEVGNKTNAGKCLTLADVNFYNSLEDIKKLYGKIYQSGYDQENNIWYAFLVNPSDKKSPILTVTVKDDKVIRLNLKGYTSQDKIAFSSIRLGDYYTFVKQRLGEPAYKKDVQAAGDETWVYTSVPISVVFRLNKVSAITIEPFQL